ncbi:LamG-like jellyroll fold domain-containing protein [Paenibacillus macerans]|uniref:LamG-like jellyroll fold domain-containing protein n=1 Tax=Paenibacillus macerans TaxID=44252 RepID=UPI003D31EC66
MPAEGWASSGGSADKKPSPAFVDVSVHDSNIVKDGSAYYVFGSHIEAAKSADLMQWTTFTNGYQTPGNAIFGDLSDNLAGSFAWAGEDDADSKGGYAVWAPAVIWNEHYRNADGTKGAYMMYYSASSTYIRSAIGYAVAKNIEGPYTYVDTVIYSGFTKETAFDANSQVNKKWTNTNIKALVEQGKLADANPSWFNGDGSYNNAMYPNAIDAALFFEEGGKLWMTYGSWSGGIFIVQLDPATGQVMYPGEDGTTADGRPVDRYFGSKIAGGFTKSGEGPYILYDKASGYYYLNVSYGWLGANGGYNIRQFRSTSPDGPYLDASGQNAVLPGDTDNAPYGIKMVGNFLFDRKIGDPGTGIGYGYASPGHNSLYFDEAAGKYFSVFHTRFPQRGEVHEVRVHQLFMNKNGWLVMAPERYAGESLKKVTAYKLAGDYQFVNHGQSYSGEIPTSVHITLNKDYTITGSHPGTWKLNGSCEAALTIDGVAYDGVFVAGWDPNQGRETMTFTAVSAEGKAIWGIRQPEMSDRQIVNAVREALSLGDTGKVMNNLTLPAEGTHGAKISWSSSDSGVISETGVIYPPDPGETDAKATLTAAITKGKARAAKQFTIIVAPIDTSYGLTAHYGFEGDLSEAAGRFADGAVTGAKIDAERGTITYADGVQGQAAVFDGNSGIRLADGLISGNRYSVSLWLNPQQFTQFTTSFFGAESNASWISLVPDSWDHNTMLWSGEAWYDGTTGSRISAGEWHHVAFTVDAGAVKVFVDGEPKFSGTGFPDIFTDGSGIFGFGVNWWDPPYQGLMDELRVYDLPITEAVIRKLFEEGRAG